MSDDNRSSMNRRWKSCDHVKVVVDYPRSILSFYATTNHGTNSPRWYWVTNVPSDSLVFAAPLPTWVERPTLYETNQDGKFASPVPGLQNFISAGFQSMLPGIRPQLSVLNTIAEMRDFKSLGRTVNRISAADNTAYRYLFSKRVRGLTKGRDLKLKQVVRMVAKAGSDSYLQSQFNILPLIRDLRGLYEVSRSADLQVQKLLDQEGQLKMARYARPLADIYSDAEETSNPDYGISSLIGPRQFARLTRYIGRPMFRMQMSYSYTLRDYQRLNAALLGRLDSIGAGGFRPSVIWNAIPWSFVVDWFIGVSQWLKDNMDEGALKPITRIHGYLWSTSIVRQTIEGINLTVSCPYLPSTMVTWRTTLEEAYKRSTQGLDVISSIRLSGLSLKEFSLASALAMSRA